MPLLVQGLRQMLTEKSTEIQMVSVFKVANQRINRKPVGPNRRGGIKGWRVVSAVWAGHRCTQSVGCQRQSTTRALKGREPWEIARAGRTDRSFATRQTTQHTILGQQSMSQ